MKKKNYNAFKMIGSYIGIILVFLLIRNFFIFYINSNNILYGWMIAGFLAGWGIHSLIRRFKK